MAERLHPGVYVEEVRGGSRPIEGVSTSTAAFVGLAVPRGPSDQAYFVTSFEEYEKIFGGHAADEKGYLPAAVEAFFASGGTRAYVVGVLAADAGAGSVTGGLSARAEPACKVLNLRAKSAGKWSSDLRIKIKPAASEAFDNEAFSIEVSLLDQYMVPRLVEKFEDVRMDPDHEAFVVSVIKRNSKLIEVESLYRKTNDGYVELPQALPRLRATRSLNEKYEILGIDKIDSIKLTFSLYFGEELLRAKDVVIDKSMTTWKAVTDAIGGGLGADYACETIEGRFTIAPTLNSTEKAKADTDSDKLRITVVEQKSPTNGISVLQQLGLPAAARGYSKGSLQNPELRPAETKDFITLDGGNDGVKTPGSAEFEKALAHLDYVEVNLLAIPGRFALDFTTVGTKYCDGRRDCFFIGDGPGGKDHKMTADELRNWVLALPNPSKNAAIYYPWLQATDPVGVGRNPTRYVPPSGYVAGIFARTDNSRGVWKAPAGVEAIVRGVLDVQVPLGDGDQDLLNNVGLDCIRRMPGAGIVVWGARTLATQSDPEWRYVPVRRLGLFLKESIRRGMQWAVFEPNDAPLWEQIRITINAFMLSLFRQGAFQGSRPDEAFYVRCDRSTNPQDLVDQGIVTAKVGFAPLKPAEFVVIEISQKSLVS